VFARKCKPFAVTAGGCDFSVEGTSSGTETDSGTTDHAITIPAGSVGDLIIVLFGVDAAPSLTHTGYTRLFYENGASNSFSLAVLYREATGSDSLTVVTGSGEQSAWIVLRVSVSGSYGVSDAEIATTSVQTTSINPPSLTLAQSANALWIEVMSMNAPRSASIALQDATWEDLGYYGSGSDASTTAASIGAAYLIDEAQSQDPDGWTHTFNQHNIAATFAVYCT
jgi:hypothetical protein